MVFAQIRHQFTKHLPKRAGGTALLTSLVVAGGLMGLRQIGILQGMELDAYDRFIRFQPREATDERVLVVGVEESDIQALQEYPLHDATLAQALSTLESYDPRTIGIDIARDVPQGPPEGRAALIDVLSSSDRIVSACLLSSEVQPGVPPAPGTPPDLVGFADFPEDIGGVIRRNIMISAPAPSPVVVGEPHLCNDDSPENEVLSLSFLLALIYLESEGIFPDQTEWGALRIGSVVFDPLGEKSGGYASTGATDYQVMLNYRSNVDAVRQVTLMDVLDERVDPDWVKDSVVLIGYTSQVANDMFITPYTETQPGMRGMAGVVVHAQAVSQILSAVLDQRPLIRSFSEPVEGVWVVLWALAGGAIALLTRPLPMTMLTLGITVAATWGLSYALLLQGLWFPVVPSILAVTITTISLSLIQRATQSGYAQAIYEQLRDQLQGRSPTSGKSNDYLLSLVSRAQAIREGKTGDSIDLSPSSRSSSPTTTLQFDSPEAQTIYEQIKEKAIRDFEHEQAALEAEQARQRADAQRRQLEHLLKKAKTTRAQTSIPDPPSR